MSICQTYQYNIKLLSYIDKIMKIVNNINHYINFKKMKHNMNDMNILINSIDIINEINIEIRNIKIGITKDKYNQYINILNINISVIKKFIVLFN